MQKQSTLLNCDPQDVKSIDPSHFGSFLAGLIDADGYLRHKELALTLHQNDVPFATMLQQRFGGELTSTALR